MSILNYDLSKHYAGSQGSDRWPTCFFYLFLVVTMETITGLLQNRNEMHFIVVIIVPPSLYITEFNVPKIKSIKF